MSAHTRREIVEAALPLFAREGFERVSLRAIGTRVGLHNSSLFHHFRGKGEIVQGVLRHLGEGLLPLLAPLAPGAGPAGLRLEVLEDVAGALIERFAARPEEARLLVRVLLDPPAGRDARRAIPAVAVRLFTSLQGWLGRASQAGTIRPVQPEAAARAVLGTVLLGPALGALEPSRPDPDRTRRRRDELVAFLRAALRP